MSVARAFAQINNTVTAQAHDDDTATLVSASASDSVTYQEDRQSVVYGKSVDLGGRRSIAEKTLTYSFTVTNTSTASTHPVTATSLSDTVLGALLPAFEADNGCSYVVPVGV